MWKNNLVRLPDIFDDDGLLDLDADQFVLDLLHVVGGDKSVHAVCSPR